MHAINSFKIVIGLFKLNGKFLQLASLYNSWVQSCSTMADICQNPDNRNGDVPWSVDLLETPDIAVCPRWFLSKETVGYYKLQHHDCLHFKKTCWNNYYRLWAKLIEIMWAMLGMTSVDIKKKVKINDLKQALRTTKLVLRYKLI